MSDDFIKEYEWVLPFFKRRFPSCTDIRLVTFDFGAQVGLGIDFWLDGQRYRHAVVLAEELAEPSLRLSLRVGLLARKANEIEQVITRKHQRWKVCMHHTRRDYPCICHRYQVIRRELAEKMPEKTRIILPGTQIVSWYKSPGYFWIRFFGYGIHMKHISQGLLFSERMGLRRSFKIGSWRFRFLEKYIYLP